MRYRATDYVRTEARMQDDPSVWSAFEGSQARSGDLAVAELAGFYGMKGAKNDGDNGCATDFSLFTFFGRGACFRGSRNSDSGADRESLPAAGFWAETL